MGVYLDHAATTPLSDAARAAMEPFWSERFGNPSEPHAQGRAARAALEEARAAIAACCAAEPRQVVFTGSGTEASNQAVFGLAGRDGGRVVCSAIEHAAVREPVRELARRGFEVVWISAGAGGRVDPDEFAEALTPGTVLAALMWANNVTGVVQPVEELAARCRERGVPLHVDAVQAAAAVPLDFRALGAQTLALSAHKLGGPKGCGCLVAQDPGRLAPLILGGGQERGLRSGTENVAAAAGFAAAFVHALGGGGAGQELRERLEAGLPAGVTALCAASPRLPRTSLLLLPGVRAELAVLALDDAGYAVSAGSACAAGDEEPSHVLLDLGLSPQQSRAVIRVSFGRDTSGAEVDGFCAALGAVLQRLVPGTIDACIPTPSSATR